MVSGIQEVSMSKKLVLRYIFSTALLMILAVAFSGCNFNPTFKKENKRTYLQVSVSSVSSARATAIPHFTDVSEISDFTFTLSGKGPGASTFTALTDDPTDNPSGEYAGLSALTAAAFPIETGAWTFKLTATKDGTVLNSGEVSKTIGSGSNTISFSLKWDDTSLDETKTGSLSFTLDFSAAPNKDDVKIVTGGLVNTATNTTVCSETPILNRTTSPTVYTATYDSTTIPALATLSAGKYRIFIRLYTKDGNTNGQVLINTWTELAIITGGQESTGSSTMNSLNEVYTINWNLDGGSSSVTLPECYTRLSSDYDLPEVSKDGYVFDGWYTGANGTGKKVETIAHGSTGIKNLYANWIIKSFSVNFNTGGGSTVASVSTNYGNLPPRPETDPTHTDYAFDDWYTDSDYATVYDFETMPITETTTIYAHWVDTYAQVGGINYSTLERTCNAIKTASSTDDISVVICKAINASTELGKAATNGTIINAIKNTTAKTVALSLKDGVSITLPEDCSNMFLECQKVSSFSFKGFVTSGVTSMNAMFSTCYKLATIDFEGINTSSVTDISSMFLYCSAISSLDLSSFDTSNVTLMWNVFFQCSNLESVNVSSFNTSKVTGLPGMFAYCEKLQSLDLSNFDTSKCTEMQQLFLGCKNLTSLNVTSFNTSIVESIPNMFEDCKKLTTLDLSSFDTNNVSSAFKLFKNCQMLQTIIVSNKFDLSKAKNQNLDDNIFTDCAALEGGAGTSYIDTNPTDSTYAHIDESGNPGYFTARPNYARVGTTYCSNLSETISAISSAAATDDITITLFGDVTASDIGLSESTGKIANAIHDTSANSVKLIVDADANISLAENSYKMFYDCTKLVSADLRGFETTSVTDMSYMFAGCQKLVNVNISSFDTSSVTTMSHMFNGCQLLKTLNFDTTKFNTASVEIMDSMFAACIKITSIDVSHFNTSNVTTMSAMFNGCTALTEIDVSSFDTSRVGSMDEMFSGCIKLTSLDLSSFDTSSVTEMTQMFQSDFALQTISVTQAFVTTAPGLSATNMFESCTKLVGGAGTPYNSSYVDATYARIDDPDNSKPGYFTGKPLGTKSSPDEVGDIVFNDGSAIPYTSGLTLNSLQKSNAVAVVFYAGTGLNDGGDTTTRILGMPFTKYQYQEKWCIDGAAAYDRKMESVQCTYNNTNGYTFTYDKDGRDSLEVMKDELENAGETSDVDAESNYPAFYAAKNYGSSTTATAGTKYENGWYLPTAAELYAVYQFWASDDSPLDSIAELVKGSDTTFLGDSGKTLMSASQNSLTTKDIIYVQFNTGGASVAVDDKASTYMYLCPIIQLNQ